MSTNCFSRKTSESVEDLHIGKWGYEESKSKSLKNYYLMKFQLKLVISSKRQITSNRMKSLISDWSPISKLLRHFSLSSKSRKLQKISSKRQISSNRMKSLISDWSPISKLLRHFSLSSKLRKLQKISSKRQITWNRWYQIDLPFPNC